MDMRNTQFLGTAQQIVDELRDKTGIIVEPHAAWAYVEPLIELIIAQHLYDFACHVATQTILHAHGEMSKVPDMPGKIF